MPLPAEVLYNIVLVAIDAAALYVLWRFRRPLVGSAVMVLAVALVFILAFYFGGRSFLGIRLASYGLFLHLPLLFVVRAVLLWNISLTGAVFYAFAAVLLGAIAFDAFFVEPEWLEVTRYDIASAKIREPLRIAVIADLQTDAVGPYQERVLKAAMEEMPDLIIFAGDYIHVDNMEEWRRLRDALNACLRRAGIDAPLGVYAIRGNTDPDSWAGIFDGLPVTCIEHTRDIELGGIKLTFLSMYDSYNRALEVQKAAPFHIVIGHFPDFALGPVKADLLLAGHTHGGQVRLPWIGPLITLSRIPKDWASGLTALDGGRTLIVSRGVGLECIDAPRMRFLCRPELVVLKLHPLGIGARL